MSFTVTARHHARDVSFQRGSLLAALEQALTLASAGMEGILVRDGSGRSRTPAELSRELFTAGTGRDTAAPQPRAA
ncbi:hypothetical protein [Methylobacterium brachythecii]|uniref:Uncharacterized protein n=1 Tax=Methylobacterium brachythecii TaxID=1176177 RepID=A0A7W6AG89_9HYPH|nr:hypothetical protein [Methylobacterium brachythecii]MBB3902783.1 hypothetical protein [Methylobacterium brachythecii]GLS43708.1 hypothetical protein GCM10007884_16930 [Methylobacterium brachythecii]